MRHTLSNMAAQRCARTSDGPQKTAVSLAGLGLPLACSAKRMSDGPQKTAVSLPEAVPPHAVRKGGAGRNIAVSGILPCDAWVRFFEI